LAIIRLEIEDNGWIEERNSFSARVFIEFIFFSAAQGESSAKILCSKGLVFGYALWVSGSMIFQYGWTGKFETKLKEIPWEVYN